MSVHALERLKAAFGDRYAIERELGSGATATVYLARDVKHHRDVAVKVLHPELAAALGTERFLREVDVLAHLQHPHILPLFDSGQADGCLYYVMPRVEGESLRDRLLRERQLPIREALQITRDVAAALDYAHRRHVIHRDIKPANILLHDEQALVADFGIALPVSATAEERMTGTGLSIGTPHYMSPEQAAGDRNIDARSDVYSLAAVLYEMLTGEPPHSAPDMQVLLARVMTQPVRPARTLRNTVPPHVEAALQKALSKLPADRFSSTATFAQSLAEPNVPPEIATSLVRRPPRKWSVAAVVGGWAVVAAGILIGAWAWQGSRTTANPESAAVRRWSIVLADSAPLAFVGRAALGTGQRSLEISPDGSMLAYVAQQGASTQVYLRELDELDATPLPGTIGANLPFFSPDGQWIGFFAGRELKKVSVRGGNPVTLATVTEPYGAAWASDDRILVVDLQGERLSWVPSGGGAPQTVSRQIEMKIFGPELLADDKWVLHGSMDDVLYLHSLTSGWPYAITRDGVVRRDSADLSTLLYGDNPRYLTSGHISYFSGDGTLMALPFDIARRRVLGRPAAVLEGARLEVEQGGAQLTVSRGGTLVYARGENARLSHFVWADHVNGRIDTLPLPRAAYGGFDLSRDGRQILVRTRSASSQGEIWVLDTGGGLRTRVPTQGIVVGSPNWWPDGARVMFQELPPDGGRSRITLRQSLRNSAERDTLPVGSFWPGHDGRHLVHYERGALWLVPIEESGRRVQLTPSGRWFFPAFSPNGQWLAYTDLDDLGGESAVYATRVDHPAERYKISAAGGEEPVWAPNGESVIYRDRQEWLAVDVSTTGVFQVGRPRVLFRGPFLQVSGMSHDVSPDGRRQLVLIGPSAETTNRLVVVTNWFTEVERLVPNNGR